jgi:HrpA-like RNA helicase
MAAPPKRVRLMDAAHEELEEEDEAQPHEGKANTRQGKEGGGAGPGQQAGRKTFSRHELRQHRTQLPIFEARAALIAAIQHHQISVVVGETGSGKTTQLPQYLFEAGLCAPNRAIAVTQPRRVAAITVAERVAAERGVPVGSTVRSSAAGIGRTRKAPGMEGGRRECVCVCRCVQEKC